MLTISESDMAEESPYVILSLDVVEVDVCV